MAFGNLRVIVHEDSQTDASVLEGIITSTNPGHILVLSPDRAVSEEADAQTLLTLMGIDAALARTSTAAGRSTNVVAEILLPESVDLALIANPDDFIVSDRLVSLLITQLAENRKRKWIFDEIFRPGGTRIEMHSVDRYGGAGHHTYAELIDRGGAEGVVVIGWQKHQASADGRRFTNEPTLNPPREAAVNLDDADRVIAMVPH